MLRLQEGARGFPQEQIREAQRSGLCLNCKRVAVTRHRPGGAPRGSDVPGCLSWLHTLLQVGWEKETGADNTADTRLSPPSCPHSTCPSETHSLLETQPLAPGIIKNKALSVAVSTTTSTGQGIHAKTV